jgi:four helix bundle protein
MEIFELSRAWPAEERYSLTDADGENGETDTWLDYALDCKYLAVADHSRLTEENRAVGSMLGAMLNNPHTFLAKKS